MCFTFNGGEWWLGILILSPKFTAISVRTVSVAGTGEVAETGTDTGTSTVDLVVVAVAVVIVVVVTAAVVGIAAAEKSAVADTVNRPVHSCMDSHNLYSSQ